jgi:hypothetical protein
MSDINPEPWRYPGSYYTPRVCNRDPLNIEVGFPNEDPETEDDLSLVFAFTHEGVIIDAYVSDGVLTGTIGMTYDEWYESIVGSLGGRLS